MNEQNKNFETPQPTSPKANKLIAGLAALGIAFGAGYKTHETRAENNESYKDEIGYVSDEAFRDVSSTNNKENADLGGGSESQAGACGGCGAATSGAGMCSSCGQGVGGGEIKSEDSAVEEKTKGPGPGVGGGSNSSTGECNGCGSGPG